jgi:thiol-disulfide isomerase/thioredoxin
VQHQAEGRVVIALLAAALMLRLAPLDEAGYRKLVESHQGQAVLVDFWATWCVPCREELPVLAALQKKLRARGLVLITVSADEPEQESDARDLLRKTGVPPPAYIKQAIDNEAFINAIDPKWSGALPALFLYDRKGGLQRSFVGETSAAEIEAAVKALL